MRRLMLLRHAKSDWTCPGVGDRDRGLTQRGRESALKVGEYMACHALGPDLAVCSPVARARDTWAIVSQAFADPPPLHYEERLYETKAEAILQVISGTEPSVHALLVVGHNPGLRDLAELLIATGDLEVRRRLLEKFPTAGLAVIDFALDESTRIHPRAGRLDRFIVPRQLVSRTD